MILVLLLMGFFTLGVCIHHQYHFINENKTWTEAQRYCRENYVDLATINNIKEERGLINIIDIWKSRRSWIGLYDDLNSWKWSLDDDAFYKEEERSFRNWYKYKPGNRNGNSFCAYFRADAIWWEVPCSKTLPFICFDGSVNATERYVVVDQKMNWTEAQKYCREHYTDLTSVRSEAENKNIKSVSYKHSFIDAVWIGLYRTMSWSDKSNTSFRNWKPGQPDNYRQSERCTAVSFKDFGKWTDEHCGQGFPFLCYNTSSHQYHFVHESKTWTEAQRYCREKYTDLATIDNLKEMNTLLNMVNGSYSGFAWIGLHDDLDSWRWSLDDDAFYQEGERDFRGWDHQPDNYVGQELCVYMSSRGDWFDQPCTNRNGFVCYNGIYNTYVWIYQTVTWEEAQTFCRVKYTDLASVRNENELQQILNITNGNVWIGLYRKPLWSDQSTLTFTYWRRATAAQPAEPDNGLYSPGQHGDQQCTAVDHLGQWTDENCIASFPFICYTRAVHWNWRQKMKKKDKNIL